jgi:hypothetical protein
LRDAPGIMTMQSTSGVLVDNCAISCAAQSGPPAAALGVGLADAASDDMPERRERRREGVL